MGIAEVVRDPGGYTRRQVDMYRRLLFSPRDFYDEYIGTHGLRAEGVLVAAIGIIGTIGTMIAVYQVRWQFEAGPFGRQIERGVEMQLWRVGVEPFFYAFVFWIGMAALLYGASWLYSEDGSFYVLVKKTAWALVPFAFANAILTAAYAYAGMVADIETDLTAAGGTTAMRFAATWNPVAHSEVVIVAQVVSILFVAWCGYIAAYAVVEVRDIEISQAYRVAAVPVVVYGLWVGYNVIGAL